MIKDKSKKEVPKHKPQVNNEAKYYELELGQVITRFNSLETFRVQLGTFFGTANLTAVGIGLSTQSVGILLIASTILVVFMIIDRRLRLLTLAYVVRGIQLQQMFVPSDSETFLQVLPGGISDEAKKIADIENATLRRQSIRRSKKSFQSIFFLVPIFTFVGEVTTALVLLFCFNWSMF